MNMHRGFRAVFAAASALCVASAIHAQQSAADSARRDSSASTLSCSTSYAQSSKAEPSTPVAAGPRSVAPSDTTFRISIADRDWQRTDYSAGAALGASGVVNGSGTWTACAGASVHLGTVTIHLHDVYGLIRIHTDASALQAIGSGSNDSLAHRGGPPPSIPPRR